MHTCHYCGAESSDLESHAETHPACARKALAFIRGTPAEWYAAPEECHAARSEKAAAIHRARKRLQDAERTAASGWEPIILDGIDCLIGWTDDEDDWDGYYAVLRHGGQIGKAVERERAIADARKTLAQRGCVCSPKPVHPGELP